MTVAAVPTGMNMGVGTTPCGVARVPTRAAPSRAATAKVRGGLLTDGYGEVEEQAGCQPVTFRRCHPE